MKSRLCFVLLLSFLFSSSLLAEPRFKELESRSRALKWQLLQLNQELLQLDEKIRYPESTRSVFFVALEVGFFFQLQTLQLKIDGVEVAHSDYNSAEIQALKKGGVQRLYVGNLSTGKHELLAVFHGVGPNQRDYKRAAKFQLDKKSQTQFIKLKIRDKEPKQQPEFVISQW